MMIDVQKYLYRLRDINELIIGVADEIELWKVIASKPPWCRILMHSIIAVSGMVP